MQSRSTLLQSISGFVYNLNIWSTSSLLPFVVALVTSFRSTPDYQVTDHLIHGQKPWTELQSVTRSLFKVSSLNQRTLCTKNLHFTAPPEWWTCAAIQFPCVIGVLIRMSLCHWMSVSGFTLFSSILEFCSLWSVNLCWTPFPWCHSTSNVHRTVSVLSVF